MRKTHPRIKRYLRGDRGAIAASDWAHNAQPRSASWPAAWCRRSTRSAQIRYIFRVRAVATAAREELHHPVGAHGRQHPLAVELRVDRGGGAARPGAFEPPSISFAEAMGSDCGMWEAMRELCHLLAELDEMARAARQWPRLDPNSRALRSSAKAATVAWACDEERGKISRFADAMRRRIESIERTAAADVARFAGHGLGGVNVEVKLLATKHATLTLADRYARVNLLAAERAVRDDDGPYGTGRAKARELLAGAVRFALRLHELAGGFDASSREALEDVRAFLASIDETRVEV